jgi:hypothetical protein
MIMSFAAMHMHICRFLAQSDARVLIAERRFRSEAGINGF